MNRSTWWRRNRLWLALLLPLLGLAVVTSSFRMLNLYLPWQWSRPIVAHGPSGTLTQRFLGVDGHHYERTVDVTVDGIAEVPSLDRDAAAPGATLWRIDLTLAATPDQVLTGCVVELVGPDGTRYATTSAGKVAADPADRFWMRRDVVSCVPEETPGPDIDAFGLQPAEVARPERWRVTTAAAVPDGVVPRSVRIMWTRPVYLELDAPS